MAIPKAVGPGQLTPGLYLVVDLLAGEASPSSGALRVALVGSKSSAGDLTETTEVRAGGGTETAQVAYGVGTASALGAERVYETFPAAVMDFIAVPAGAGTSTLALTLSGTPSSNNAVLLDIMGRTFSTSWLSAETAEDASLKIIDAINQRTEELACVASDGGVGIITIDSKVAGNIGNDIKVQATLLITQTNTEAIAGALVPTPLVGGTTDPDFATALSNLEGTEYAFILPILSNTDAANVSTQSNAGLVIDHINGLNTGLNARLQQVIAGLTTTIALGTAATPDANGFQNDGVGELALCVNGRGLPGELAGREVGGWLLGLSTDPAVNRIGEQLSGYIGSSDINADTPSESESETALGNGVSIVSYTAQGLEIIVRPITTHSQTDTGAPDRRLLDGQNVAGAYIVARDIRDNLPLAFPQAKITPDTEPGSDPPQKGVTEERDIKAWVIARLKFWDVEGVVQRDALQEAIDDGSLIVEVDSGDPTQVNLVLPYSILQPLAKFGVVAQRVPN